PLVIQPDEVRAEQRPRLNLDPASLAQCSQLIEGWLGRDIDLAGLEAQDAGVVLGHHEELNVVEVRLRRVPAVGIGFQYDPDALLPALEGPVTCADRTPAETGRRSLLEPGFRVDRRDRDLWDGRRRRRLEVTDDGAIVRRRERHPGRKRPGGDRLGVVDAL